MPANLLTTVDDSCLRFLAERDLRSVSDSEHDRGRGQGRFSFAGGPADRKRVYLCNVPESSCKVPVVSPSQSERSDVLFSEGDSRKRAIASQALPSLHLTGALFLSWVKFRIGLWGSLKQLLHSFPRIKAFRAGPIALASQGQSGWQRVPVEPDRQ